MATSIMWYKKKSWQNIYKVKSIKKTLLALQIFCHFNPSEYYGQKKVFFIMFILRPFKMGPSYCREIGFR